MSSTEAKRVRDQSRKEMGEKIKKVNQEHFAKLDEQNAATPMAKMQGHNHEVLKSVKANDGRYTMKDLYII